MLVTGGIALVFLRARFTGPNNLLTHPDYAPVFTVRRYLECTAHYLDQLTARADLWTPETAGLLLSAMAALAILARSRTLLFAWLLVVLGAAPMAFVSPRGLSAYYIPVLGYAIFLAAALVRGRELAARVLRAAPHAGIRVSGDPVCFSRCGDVEMAAEYGAFVSGSLDGPAEDRVRSSAVPKPSRVVQTTGIAAHFERSLWRI